MSGERITVVGAVIVSDRRILAARRVGPPELAGLWEFPGGKVESGEDARSALVREVQEELGAVIAVLNEVAGNAGPWPISEKYVLRLFLAALAAGDPRPGRDHDEVRWLSANELNDVEWLPSDLAALETVKRAVLALTT